MPVDYSIDPARRLVVNTGTGVLTDAELRDTQRRMVADPAFLPTYSQLFDLTGVTEARISSAYIREMASVSAFAPGARRALVADQTLLYGLSRMFQAALDDPGEQLQVFRTRAEAESWIGADRTEE